MLFDKSKHALALFIAIGALALLFTACGGSGEGEAEAESESEGEGEEMEDDNGEAEVEGESEQEQPDAGVDAPSPPPAHLLVYLSCDGSYGEPASTCDQIEFFDVEISCIRYGSGDIEEVGYDFSATRIVEGVVVQSIVLVVDSQILPLPLDDGTYILEANYALYINNPAGYGVYAPNGGAGGGGTTVWIREGETGRIEFGFNQIVCPPVSCAGNYADSVCANIDYWYAEPCPEQYRMFAFLGDNFCTPPVLDSF